MLPVGLIFELCSKAIFGKFGVIKIAKKGNFCVQDLVTLNTMLPNVVLLKSF